LRELTRRDLLKRERDEARNAVEAFAYNTLNNVEDEEFKAATKPDVLEQIQKNMHSALEWLETDEARSGSTQTFKAKLQEIRAPVDPILLRRRERQTLPPAVKELRELISKAHNASAVVSKRKDLETEVAAIIKEVNATETWLDSNLAKQQALAADADPVLLTNEVETRGPALERSIRALEILKRRPLPKPSVAEKKKKVVKKVKKVKLNDTEEAASNSTEVEEEVLVEEVEEEEPLDGEEPVVQDDASSKQTPQDGTAEDAGAGESDKAEESTKEKEPKKEEEPKPADEEKKSKRDEL
jgi:hypoxia up-regulated 1